MELGRANVGSHKMRIERLHVKKVVKCKVMPPPEGLYLCKIETVTVIF